MGSLRVWNLYIAIAVPYSVESSGRVGMLLSCREDFWGDSPSWFEPAALWHEACGLYGSINRRFLARRGIRIAVRTVHIGSVVLFMSAVFSGTDPHSSGFVLVLSGFYLVSDKLLRDGLAHFRYLSFWVVFLKLVALCAGLIYRPILLESLWACLILGSLISHAPGTIRHFALWGKSGPCADKSSLESRAI